MTFWADKSVMLTGGGGFIGGHVADRLRSHGVKHLFIVRSKEYNLTRETEVVRLFAEHPSEVVIHVAGTVAGIYGLKTRPVESYYTNLLMGALVMHNAWKSGARKLLAIGAGCGYPQNASNPLKEEDLWNGLPQPETAAYALAKRFLSVQADAYFREYKFPSIVAVPGNVYGPNDNFELQNANVIPALVRKFVEASQNKSPSVEVWGTGRAARDFIHVRDLVEGMLRAAELVTESTVINLSAGRETPIRHVVEILQKVTGFGGEVVWNTDRPDGQLHRYLDTGRAERLLGWRPATDLEEGLRETAEWYRGHQDVARK